ncbi:MAG TPA: hypothetical protein VIL00_17600 [Pseudonocardiaceae bacterium]
MRDLSAPLRIGRATCAAALAVGTLLGAAGPASAASGRELNAGDSRATAYPGNATLCQDDVKDGEAKRAPLPGVKLRDLSEIRFDVETSNGEQVSVDITGLPDDLTVTGVVVKGGNAYNVYPVDMLKDLPWLDLHSPNNNGGQRAAISHWFLCVQKTAPTSTTTPSSTDAPEPEVPSSTVPSAAPSATPTTAPSTGDADVTPSGGPTVTTTSDTAPGVVDDDLANTGADVGWLLWLGGALLAGGAALIALPRVRARLRRRD